MRRQHSTGARIAGIAAVGTLVATVITTEPAHATAAVTTVRSLHQQVASELPAAGSDGVGWGAAAQERENKPTRLVMVAPQGGIVPIGDLPDDTVSVAYVSPDAGTVVTTTGDPLMHTVLGADIWDTHTHTRKHVDLPLTGNYAENFLAFSARGFYVERVQDPTDEPGSQTSQIEFRDYTGKVRHTTAKVSADSKTLGIVASADGSRLMQFGKNTIYLRSTSTGKVEAKFAAAWNPKLSLGCTTEGHYDAGSAKLTCAGSNPGEDGTFAVSFATGKRTYLAHTTATSDAIPVSGGTVLNDWQDNTGGWKFYPAKGAAKSLALTRTSAVVGSDHNDLFVVDRNGGSILRYNARTGAKRILAGSSSTGGGTYYDAKFVSRWQQD